MTTSTRAVRAEHRDATVRRRRTPRGTWWANLATYAFLLAAATLTVAPYVLSVMNSLKTPRQFFLDSALAAPNPATLTNYATLFDADHNFLAPIAVTLQMTLVLVAGQMTISVMAAYAFATLRFPGKEAIFWAYLITMMVPQIVTVIPLFLMVSSLGLRDTFWGLVIPFVLGSPYAIFLLRQNFQAVPSDLLDAATLDGAGVWRRLWSVVLPMNRPILVTLLLITVVTQWNSFLWPLIVTTSPTWRTITVATSALRSQYNANWTLVLAATTVAMAPLIVLFIVFQRYIVRSIGITGIR